MNDESSIGVHEALQIPEITEGLDRSAGCC
jgi:hypothetical protein